MSAPSDRERQHKEAEQLIASLSEAFSGGLTRLARDATGVVMSLPAPLRLQAQAERLALLFDDGVPPKPPMQMRARALERLRSDASALGRRDWILLCWALCDPWNDKSAVLDDDSTFDAIATNVDTWVMRLEVPRKGWFGLLNGYCSYDYASSSTISKNWLRLRDGISRTLPILLTEQNRTKSWGRALIRHSDILTDRPGVSLAAEWFDGGDKSELLRSLPIPADSWLWVSIVKAQVERLSRSRDDVLNAQIPIMMRFAAEHPRFADDMLGASLTRYCQSSMRAEPHEFLKNESFKRWGNPQLKTSHRWGLVEPEVKAMVLQWFAKEDLEHFFSLLQGSGGVDDARLRYWLRFVDQISYTRILMGSDAFNNKELEFRNFRHRNAGRFGRLAGTQSQSHANAFIMKIGDYYLVEFSATGNACYGYHESELPFDCTASYLSPNSELKKKTYNELGENYFTHGGSWFFKADLFLRRRGIFAGEKSAQLGAVAAYQVRASTNKSLVTSTADGPSHVNTAQLVKNPIVDAQNAHAMLSQPGLSTAAPLAHATKPSTFPSASLQRPAATAMATAGQSSRTGATSVEVSTTSNAVEIALELARINGVRIENNVSKGGVLWILATERNSVLGKELTRLGFKFHAARGFWIQ